MPTSLRTLLCLAEAAAVHIALYGGGGAILGDDDYPYLRTLEQAAAAAFGTEASVSVLLEEGVRQNLTNDAFDIVFFPGGSGHGQATSLGADGLAAVQAFVAGGGGYVGTCAGSFLAMSSLKLYGEGLSLKGGGTGVVQMELAELGFQELELDREAFAGNVSIFYQGGPVVAPESLPEEVEILAWYRSELPSLLPWGHVGLNTPAVTASRYGAGRVVLNSPHAEHTKSGGIGQAFYQGELAWVLRRDPTPTPAPPAPAPAPSPGVMRCCYSGADCNDCDGERDYCSASLGNCQDCSGSFRRCASDSAGGIGV